MSIQPHQFGSLVLSCGEFIALHRGTSYAGHAAASSPAGEGNGGQPPSAGLPHLPLVTCPPSASLRQVRCVAELLLSRLTAGRRYSLLNPNPRQVVALMTEQSIHHCWVVDAQQTPLAIITPGDILTLIVKRSRQAIPEKSD
jgi:hypothetical protein